MDLATRTFLIALGYDLDAFADLWRTNLTEWELLNEIGESVDFENIDLSAVDADLSRAVIRFDMNRMENLTLIVSKLRGQSAVTFPVFTDADSRKAFYRVERSSSEIMARILVTVGLTSAVAQLAAPAGIAVTPTNLTFAATFSAVTGAASYEWRLDSSGAWTNIGTATSISGTGTAGAHTLKVRAIDSGAVAGHIGSSSSFTLAALAAPSFSVNPVATSSGDLANPVVGDTLHSTSGTASGSPSFAYQWKHVSDNSNATGTGAATANYPVDASDATTQLYCRVTATNSGGSVTADSNSSGTVPAFTADPGSHTADTTGWRADSDIRSADGGTAVAVVTPTDLSGLKLWLSDTGSSAGTWPDLSGLANDAAQATAGSQPSIVTGVLNGKQVRRFDGVDDFMAFTASIPLSSFTFIAVIKCPGFASHFDTQFITGNISDASLQLNATGSGAMLHKAFEVEIVASGAISNSTWHIISATYNNPNGTIFIDGVLNATAASAQTFNNSTWIGRGAFGTHAFYGDMAEFVIYNRALADSSAERRALEDFFGNKYGIVVSH